jgi:ABC-type Fe3+-hydroxamate transport system substrate-binding protein
MEALASFAPGVLIHRSNDPATVDAVAGKLGIPVLCITVENYEDINYTLVMMGKYFGREERAQQVCSWLSGKFEMISEIVDLIPPGERVRALMMGGELGRIAGGEMIQSWMIEKAGGICTASGIENNRNWANVGEETIFEWNPDVIFATSSTPLNYTVQALMRDPAWSAMAAIKNQAVYIVPAGIDSWDMPGISSALGTMYMLHCMYPSYFSAEQLQSEIDEYYMFMFGKTFSSEYLGYDLAN